VIPWLSLRVILGRGVRDATLGRMLILVVQDLFEMNSTPMMKGITHSLIDNFEI